METFETYEISKEQPYIFKLTKLGVEAQRRGKGVEFAYFVSHLIFGGTRDWHKGDLLEKAVAQSGLDLNEMNQALDSGDHMSEIESNQQQLTDSGHWGVPTFVFKGEPFFGQDRIDTLRWRLEQNNLARAAD